MMIAFHPHFSGEQTEAQTGSETCSVIGPGPKPRHLESRRPHSTHIITAAIQQHWLENARRG